MEPPKPKPRLDVRRTPEDEAYVIGVHLEDGNYAAVSIFDHDDGTTIAGKLRAMADRIDPAPPTKEQLAGGRRR